MSDGIHSGVVGLERVTDKLRTELEEWAEQTRQGWHVVPTKPVKDMQFGPYYIAVIKKNARRRGTLQQPGRPQDGWEDIERAEVDRAFRK